MATLSEQLYGCLDGSKGELLLHTVDGVQLVAGSKGMLFDGQEHDPFSSCLMDMDLTSSMVEDFMVEDYSSSQSPSSTTSSPFISSQQYDTIVTSASGGMVNVEEGLYNNQWNQIPGYFQEQLFTHYGLYLKEIQQVLDMQKQMDTYSDTSSTSSSPYSSTPASPAVAIKTEKRKKTQNFKVEHYKLQNQLAKRPKREESEPLSPSNNDDNINDSNSNFSSSSPSTPILRNSNNIESSPTKTLSMVAEELASAFLPSVSQIEEEIRAGTSSPSAATTVMELSKRPELLTLKQSEAAKIMGISTSVLSKRWREATRGKKWPHRIHHKLKRAAIC